jgi:hypothetical protein
MNRLEQEIIEREVAKREFDITRLQGTYMARWTFNMKTYGELSDPNQVPKPFILKQETFF